MTTLAERLLSAICLTPHNPAGIVMHGDTLAALLITDDGYRRITGTPGWLAFCGIPIETPYWASRTGFAFTSAINRKKIVWKSDDWKDPSTSEPSLKGNEP